MTIIKHLYLDGWIVNKSEFGAHGNAAFSKLEWPTTGSFLDFLGRFFVLDFMAFWLDLLKPVGCS